MHFLRFNVFVTLLITLVSLCAARTVITVQKCTTRSCRFPVKAYKTTTTVCKNTQYTKTCWKTVIKPAKTATVLNTKSAWTVKTVTASTVYKYISSTSTETSTVTMWEMETKFTTAPVLTTTLTPKTVVIPAPSGIFGVNQDPANARQSIQARPSKIFKRAAEPEPEPAGAAGKWYPSAVVCTKTLLTKTGVSILPKTTTLRKGTTTVTKSVYRTSTRTQTVTIKNPKTVTSTRVSLSTVLVPFTKTLLAWSTRFDTTITEVVPTPTFYAACGAPNSVPKREASLLVIVGGLNYSEDEPTIYTVTENTTPHDCCVSCWTLPASQGKCIGSIHYNLSPRNCDLVGEGVDCADPSISGCRLILESKKGVCRTANYWLYQDHTDVHKYISNGPGCLRFKYKAI
ncbi:hypothetical protein TWF718_000896 [Orbilia javanica]|uniref:Uncharacterized protein n=1 Tax=Orbilia javanica TaxID=47235 RepID=A0AAN8MZZ6_9PEZI